MGREHKGISGRACKERRGHSGPRRRPDGHLGFNEPGEALYDKAHREVLDESTIDANARFFATRDDARATP